MKNLALMAYISSGTPQLPILEFLMEYGTEGLDEVPPSEIAKPTITKIFVNGKRGSLSMLTRRVIMSLVRLC